MLLFKELLQAYKGASDPHIHANKYAIHFTASNTSIVPLLKQKSKKAVRRPIPHTFLKFPNLNPHCFFKAKNLRYSAQENNAVKPFFKKWSHGVKPFSGCCLVQFTGTRLCGVLFPHHLGYANRICVVYKSLFGYYGKFRC